MATPHSVPALPASEILDIVGVGFGPSNLALAIAIDEHNAKSASDPLTARFIERQPRFGWHRGMLIEDATMQVSYLKDLVTPRSPTSPFSFVSYLHDRGRLIDFINYGSSFPTRVEFHDYLEWAASVFAAQVDYGTEVVGIKPVDSGGTGECLEVVTRRPDAGTARVRARNIVLATGLRPHLPEGVCTGARIWHSCDLLSKAATLTAPERLTVVGAGQSAAEAVDYLYRTFPSAEVCAVFARYGYSPADDTSFANRVFDPSAVDDFFRAPEGVKEMILGYHANTNYSVVDPQLIDELYRRHYREKVTGQERLRFLNVSRIADAVEVNGRIELAVESMIDSSREVLTTDLVVYATGYRPGDPCRLLGGLAGACHRDAVGRLEIRRDYRVATDDTITAGVYVQGATEHSHGLSSTLLSNTAVRAGEIVASIRAGREAPARDLATARAHRPTCQSPAVREENSAVSTNPFDDDNATFSALINSEGQYSLWPTFASIPEGWNVAHGPASRQECLDHIKANWTDMRPKSLVAQMGSHACPGPVHEPAGARKSDN